MLVLTRNIGEVITIGPAEGEGEERLIFIVVTGIRNGIVKLGIKAPDNVVILREEIANRDKMKRKLTPE